MWSHCFQTHTDLAPSQLWPGLADVAGWPQIDHNIDRIEITEPPAPGVAFRLKPKGGPMLNFVIGIFEPPHRYSDICRMPLAQMETLHTLEPDGQGTRIIVEIRITGLLASFWGWIVGRKHASGLPQQTERLLHHARRVAGDA
jgi:hypothetical protein